MSDDQSQMPTGEQPPGPQSNVPPVVSETPPQSAASHAIQILLGFVSFWLLFFGIVWLVFIAALIRQHLPHPLAQVTFSLLLTGLGVVVLASRRRHGRGLGTGVLIGVGLLGLLGLAAGICFAAMR